MRGRPKKYKELEKLEKAIEQYFEKYAEKPTLTGLAYFLGYASRQSLYDIEEKENDFSYAIKRARLRIEQAYEECLYKQSCTGAIFALKNLGWKDHQEIEHSGAVDIITHEGDGKL